MSKIPFPNPHDADSLNTYLDALAAGKQATPASDVETAAWEFHQLASRAGVSLPQQPVQSERGEVTMQIATLTAPISNRTRKQMENGKKPGRSYGWLSAVIVAGLMISMIGSAWLNREPGNPHDQLAFAPGTSEAATFMCPVTLPNHVDATGGLDHYAADGHTWFEDGIWITIPTEGVLNIGPHQQNNDPESKYYGWGFEKLFVLRGEGVSGMVDISGKRLDAQSDLQPFNDPGTDKYYGETGFVPIALMIPGEGCWEFTAVVGDASATWTLQVGFARESPWTQPISFTECPADAERNRYDPENPGDTQYSLEEYDDVSPDRSYEIVGAPDPDDAEAVVVRLRETYGCIARGETTLKVTARFEYENRTTAGRNSVEARAEERTVASESVSGWLESELELTPTGMYVHQDPDELELDGTEALINQGLFNPDHAVLFADGRIGVIPSVVSYSDFPIEVNEETIPGFSPNMSIFVFQDGEWMLDESLPVCIGDCSALPVASPVGTDGDMPGEYWGKR